MTALLSRDLMPPPTSIIMPYPRKREPSSSPGDDEDEDHEEEYQPGPSKRGGKARSSGSGPGGSTPGKQTKMSREALRKANHSLIERRRREKINFALGELREMVPGLGDEKGGKAGEFKLEVLERTVEHMKDLKAEIIELQAKLASRHTDKITKRPTSDAQTAEERSRSKHRKTTTASTTPPSPSLSPERQPRHGQTLSSSHLKANQHPCQESPDPNETESEAGLPPNLTLATRTTSSSSSSPSHPSITSLLNSSNQAHAHQLQRQPSRPPAPAEAANPTLYLPFPTPSPTSPFLTYSGTSSSVTSTSGGGGAAMEPSPFMAPLQNFSLFGGAISLDSTASPEVSMAMSSAMGSGRHQGPPDLSMPPPKGSKRVPSPEEAANLLLAFSSPDTLRPVSGGTPIFAPSGRKGTLESEDFMLDGATDGQAHHHTQATKSHGHSNWPKTMVGKTARDILRM